MPNKPQRFRDFLREDEGADAVAGGLRALIQNIDDVKNLWNSSHAEVEKRHARLLKQMPPETRKRVLDDIRYVIREAATNIGQPINVQPLLTTASNQKEAAFTVATLAAVSTGLQAIGEKFLGDAVSFRMLTDAQRQELERQYATNASIPMGPPIRAFFASHVDQFSKHVLAVADDTIRLNIQSAAGWLRQALQKMKDIPDDKKALAVRGTHYSLLHMSNDFAKAASAYRDALKQKSLPAE